MKKSLTSLWAEVLHRQSQKKVHRKKPTKQKKKKTNKQTTKKASEEWGDFSEYLFCCGSKPWLDFEITSKHKILILSFHYEKLIQNSPR